MEATSVTNLIKYFRIEHPIAEQIDELIRGLADPCEVSPACDRWVRQCWHRPNHSSLVMAAINELIGGHGVEAIWGDSPYWPVAEYVNMGDSYNWTVLYDRNNRYLLGSLADWIEKNEVCDAV